MSATVRDELVEIEMLGRRGGQGDDDSPGGSEDAKKKKKKRGGGLLELLGKLWQPRRNRYSRRKTAKRNKFSTSTDFQYGETERRIKANDRQFNAQFNYAVSKFNYITQYTNISNKLYDVCVSVG
ncbi:uncharacterized protein [Halyomorpha halys]|uniref:uncharacterized protein n=1 Tax=Halyomorpha halys TaxID=286706 RepID=UPI0034D22E9C